MTDARPRTRIMGIVNLTEDSFSDGGRYLDPEKAIEHAQRLVAEGADAIDLGPASSHPDAARVEPDEEIRRLRPVVDRLLSAGVSVSIDSFRAETQRFGLERGVAWLNDIQGFPDSEHWPRLARADCKLVVMHSIQRRGKAQRSESDPETIVAEVSSFLEQRVADLTAAGIARARIVVDPGMGFFLGRGPEASLAVLRALPGLRRKLGLPLLVSVSRKSFLQRLVGRDVSTVGAATLAAESLVAWRGVDWIRTHEVRALRDALGVVEALRQEPAPAAGAAGRG